MAFQLAVTETTSRRFFISETSTVKVDLCSGMIICIWFAAVEDFSNGRSQVCPHTITQLLIVLKQRNWLKLHLISRIIREIYLSYILATKTANLIKVFLSLSVFFLGAGGDHKLVHTHLFIVYSLTKNTQLYIN